MPAGHREATRTIKVRSNSRLAAVVQEAVASGATLLVDTGEAIYPLVPIASPPRRTYGPSSKRPPAERAVARSRAGIVAASGSWKDLDLEAFKRYLHERRATSSRPHVAL